MPRYEAEGVYLECMKQIINRQNQKHRRKILRANLTEEEKIIWAVLKKYFPEYKTRRQFGIGPYIVDFYIYSLQLAVELDGSQHVDNRDYDAERDRYLALLGITTLRFWNSDIRNNLSGVVLSIQKYITNYSNS